jgi:cytosine/adenosine deaminase-related metal-dependent hydrolase
MFARLSLGVADVLREQLPGIAGGARADAAVVDGGQLPEVVL